VHRQTLHCILANSTVTVENLSATDYSANIVLTATDGIDQTFGTVTLNVSYLSEVWARDSAKYWYIEYRWIRQYLPLLIGQLMHILLQHQALQFRQHFILIWITGVWSLMTVLLD
jgi:hypothetical protein